MPPDDHRPPCRRGQPTGDDRRAGDPVTERTIEVSKLPPACQTFLGADGAVHITDIFGTTWCADHPNHDPDNFELTQQLDDAEFVDCSDCVDQWEEVNS